MNILDAEADPTGEVDSSAAIRMALASGDAYVPRGVYLVSRGPTKAACIDMPPSSMLRGEGTLRLAPDAPISTRILHVGGADTTVEGITLDGNRAAQSVNEYRHGIFVSADRATIRNVTVADTTGDGVCLSGDNDGTSITGVRTWGCQRNGVTIGSGAITRLRIHDCDLRCAVQPIDSEPESGGPSHVTITGNVLSSEGGDYGLTVTTARYWTVTGNTIHGGIYITGSARIVIAHNAIDATDMDRDAVYVRGRSDHLVIDGNIICAATGRNGVTYQTPRPLGVAECGNVVITSGGGRALFA